MKIIKQFDYDPRNFYVYIHRRKTDNKVFYVGKGNDRRGWQRTGRNKLWHTIANKHGVLCEIVKDNLDENLSFDLEKELISFMVGLIYVQAVLLILRTVEKAGQVVFYLKNLLPNKKNLPEIVKFVEHTTGL